MLSWRLFCAWVKWFRFVRLLTTAACCVVKWRLRYWFRIPALVYYSVCKILLVREGPVPSSSLGPGASEIHLLYIYMFKDKNVMLNARRKEYPYYMKILSSLGSTPEH